MKELVLKRPLFTACTVATITAFVCSFLTASAMIAFAVAIVFAFAFVLPFKTPLKPVIFITAAACILVIASNILYYVRSYKPVTDYVDTTRTFECEVIKPKNSGAVVLCKDSNSGVKFRASVFFDEHIDLLPSSQVIMTINFTSSTRRSRNDGVHIYGTSQDVVMLKSCNPSSVGYIFYNIRQKIKNALPIKDKDAAAFAYGMIFGDTEGISGRFNNKMNEVGLSHVTSVSGMHLVFSVLLLDFVLSLFAFHHKKRALMAIISVILFTFISGFSVSCVRAAIMITIYYIGILTDRLSDSLTSLSVAVFVIILFCPQYTASLSLLLSAAATFGIIVLSPCYNKFFNIKLKNRPIRAIFYILISYLTMSLAANIACLPVTATLFEQFCVISPFVNVIVAIPIQLMFYIGTFGIVFSKIPFVSTFISCVGKAIYNVIEFVVEKCYYIKDTTVTSGYKLYYIVLALIFVLVLGLYLLYKTERPLKISLAYIGAFIVICLSLFAVNKLYLRDSVNVHFVDVGEGECSVVTKDETAVIIDCGGDYHNNIERVLQNDNVKKISLVAITHFNLDHVNYLENLLETFDVDAIVYPQFANINDHYNEILISASNRGVRVDAVDKDGEIIIFDNVKIKWFVERTKTVKPYDNMSAVYRVETSDNSILYTGDMSINQEYAYLGYEKEMDCDILSVAHHGSNTGSFSDFLNLCSPQYSVISAGDSSKSKNPHITVVERLKRVSKILLTSEQSTISFKFNNKGYKRIK